MRIRRVFLTVVVLILILFIGGELSAQCPMCRIAAESNLENGGTTGKGLNRGILYLLMMPYVIVGLIGFIWYKNRNKEIDTAG